MQNSRQFSVPGFGLLDTNGDGQQDGGEPGIGGVTVMLLADTDNDGLNDAVERRTGTSPASHTSQQGAPSGRPTAGCGRTW